MTLAKRPTQLFGNIGDLQNTCAAGVVNIVIDIGNAVGKLNQKSLKRCGAAITRVGNDTVAHLPGQIQTLSALFQMIDHANALHIMSKLGVEALSHGLLACMSEGRMPQIVTKRDGLGQILVKAQGTRQRACDLRDLQRMRQSRAVVIAHRGEEHLRFVHQAAERLAVRDAVAVTLIFGSVLARLARIPTSACISGQCRVRGQPRFFPLHIKFCHVRHAPSSFV